MRYLFGFLAFVIFWTFCAAMFEPYGWCKSCSHQEKPRWLLRWLLWPYYAWLMWDRNKRRCGKCGEQAFEWH